jgi:hypothetical protein
MDAPATALPHPGSLGSSLLICRTSSGHPPTSRTRLGSHSRASSSATPRHGLSSSMRSSSHSSRAISLWESSAGG